MRAYHPDTNPEIEQMQIELIQRMHSWKKFAMIDDLNETALAWKVYGPHTDVMKQPTC